MYQQILNFWFEELTPPQWWKKDEHLDNLIKKKFLDIHNQAIKGELWNWRNSPQGSLAEIIILDQFSRNIYRNQLQSFLYDGIALVLAQNAISKEFDQHLSLVQRSFLYLPYMHSESFKIHEEAVYLYKSLGLKENYEIELKHKFIIDKFGRYPHRNKIIGRNSTPNEIKFLQEPNSSF
jgi:uncharacterized protein (DUF924 family)